MKIDQAITYKSLQTSLNRFWQLSGKKINSIEKNFDAAQRCARLYGQWKIFYQGLDGMDPGFSVWICATSV